MEEMTAIVESEFGRVKGINGDNSAVCVGTDAMMGDRVVEEALDNVTWSGSGYRGSYKSPSEVSTRDYTFVKASSGWHSSMESSEQSKFINRLTRGDIKSPFPVLVMFTATSNVCSQGVSVYVPEGEEGAMKEWIASGQSGERYANIQ